VVGGHGEDVGFDVGLADGGEGGGLGVYGCVGLGGGALRKKEEANEVFHIINIIANYIIY
jgi:hypothetical protein